MTAPLYSVLIPRTVLHDMTPSERYQLDTALVFLGDTAVITREDRIDNVDYDDDPAYEGVKYFTSNESMFKILTEIAKSGYPGYLKNKTTIDQLIEGNN